MIRLILVMSVLAGVALAACGSSGSSSTRAATSTPAGASSTSSAQTTSTATATATVTASPTSSTTSTPSAAAGTACVAAHLSASFLGGQGATGHGELGFALRNTGPTACHTYGYPGIQFQTAAGAPLPTTPSHTTTDFFGSLPRRRLTVAPGASFSFRLGVSHGNGASTGCSTAESIAIIAPDDTVPMRVMIPQGAVECGTTTVSPVQPGTSAYR